MKPKLIYILSLLTVLTFNATADEIGSVEKRLDTEARLQAKSPTDLAETQEKANQLINKQETIEKLISVNGENVLIQESKILTEDGKLSQIVYQNTQTQQIQRLEKFNYAEKKVFSVEFDPSGRIQKMLSFDEKTGNVKACVYYDPTSLNVYRYDEYSTQGRMSKRIDLSSKTGNILSITEYNLVTGQPSFYQQLS